MPRGVNPYDEGRLQGRNVANANSSNIVSPCIVTDGLVLHLDAGNYNSYPIAGTTWYDLSGLRNNGTLTNGPIFNPIEGGSILFNGYNNYSSSPLIVSYANMTVELSFKITAVMSWVDIAVLDDGVNELLIELGGYVPGIANTNGYLRYYGYGIVTATTDGLASSSQYILDSKIHTSVLTIDSSFATSYFDGILQGTASISSSTTFTRLVLANDLLRSSRACNCRLYQVKIYNRALSAAEVSQNFNATRARFGI